MPLGLRSFLAAVLCLALAAGTLPPVLAAPAASRDAHLAGAVFGADLRTPAKGLEVRALPSGEKTPVATAVTDRRGRFDLGDLPAGEYLLVLVRPEEEIPVAAARVTARTGDATPVVLALPGADAPAEAPAASSGFAAWIATPIGATVTLVAAAVVIAVGADSLSDNTETREDEPPASDSFPPR